MLTDLVLFTYYLLTDLVLFTYYLLNDLVLFIYCQLTDLVRPVLYMRAHLEAMDVKREILCYVVC